MQRFLRLILLPWRIEDPCDAFVNKNFHKINICAPNEQMKRAGKDSEGVLLIQQQTNVFILLFDTLLMGIINLNTFQFLLHTNR